jgi:large subunit ribosomal protein L33
LNDSLTSPNHHPRTFAIALAAMAKKKTRVINVRLISMAMTGFFYAFKRPRAAKPMGMLKYDPIVRRKVLFLESKKRVR